MQPEILAVGIESDADTLAPEDVAAALAAAAEAEHIARIERLTKMRAVVLRLKSKCDEVVRAKRSTEQRMANSLRIYNGWPKWEDPTKAQSTTTSTDQAPKPRMIRARTNRWEARIVDMISANPWDLEPEEGSTREQADRMKAKIVEQFGLCKFDRILRRMAQDAARLGTGVICGPYAAVKTRRRWVPSIQVPGQAPIGGGSAMEFVETTIPEMREGDPWYFYPDMTETAERAEFAFYLHLLNETEVRALKPGFDEEQIGALLRRKPELGEVGNNITLRNRILNRTEEQTSGKFAIWHYTGPLDKEDLEILGLCGCDDEEELPPRAMSDIWFCDEFILRARLSPVPDDFRIPYYVFAPFPRDDSMFGLSLPELGEDSQRVAESSWLMALHNASVSSGPLFFSKDGVVKPRDGQYLIRGPKWFSVSSDHQGSIQDAFDVQIVPNNVESSLMLFDRAMANMDDELDTAQWGSPEGAEEHPTASGFAMIQNARSILQTRVACCADDEIFQPVVERAVWWNNDFGEDEANKGNYLVYPSVQSERLVKDIAMQHAQAFATLTDAPRFQGKTKDTDLLKYIASFLDGPIRGFVLSEDEQSQQAQNAPPDPMQVQAELLNAKTQVELAKAQTEQIKQQKELIELQLAQAQGMAGPEGPDPKVISELQLKARALDIKEMQIQSQEQIAKMREEGTRLIAAARMAETRRKAEEDAFEKQQARQTELMTEGMKTEREAKEIALKIQTGSGI